MEFDVWSNADGRLTTSKAALRFVDDSDAPYGFSRHEIRVVADCARDALAAFRAAQ